jgi:hypothetical protein
MVSSLWLTLHIKDILNSNMEACHEPCPSYGLISKLAMMRRMLQQIADDIHNLTHKEFVNISGRSRVNVFGAIHRLVLKKMQCINILIQVWQEPPGSLIYFETD